MKKNFAAMMLAGSSVLALASPALAQEEDDEIVVTGTFIRGVAPAGANVLGVNREDVAASGATATNELLTTIPQVANLFNNADATATTMTITGGVGMGINFQSQVTRPNLRNLSPTTASGSSTLVLMDGHRIVSAGINQATPDADIIPPGALERVEVVTDGGSSLYGTDAVGGVVNFITRNSYDGVGVTANYGFGDDYETYNASIIGGTDWGSGSAFASYSHQHRTEILGSDRDFVRGLEYNPANADVIANGGNPVPFSTACANPTVYIGTDTYAVSADGQSLGALGTTNRCDLTDTNTFIPEEERDIFMAGVRQELTDWADLNVRAYHSTRVTHGNGGPAGNSAANAVAVPSTNFYFPLYQQGTETSHSVRLNWAPVTGNSFSTQVTSMESWGITPSLGLDLGADWQLTLMTNYGRSETYTRNRQLNATALTAARTASAQADALNPYDLASTPADVLDEILNTGNIWGYANGRHRLINHRAVFDGPLMELPGGEIRAAVGGEFINEQFQVRNGSIPTGGEATLAMTEYARDVNAVFGEVNVPIVGPGNRMIGVESLSLSLSARYDEYEDFGTTTNPRVALTYEPTDWVLFRANWGESFNAPTVVDQANAQRPPAGNVFAAFFPEGPGTPVHTAGQTMIFLAGLPRSATPSLDPQTATTWSYGFDIAPPIIPGLTASVTYYNIEYRGQLAQPPFFDGSTMARTFPNLIDYNVTQADLDGLLGVGGSVYTAPDGTSFNVVLPNTAIENLTPSDVFAIVDARLRNLQDARHEGIDFSANYRHDTSFGSIEAGVSGNYRISYEISAAPGVWTPIDLDTNADNAGPRLRYRANIGATWGDFYARASYTHTGGMSIVPSTEIFGQTEIDSFEVVDLYFRYDLGEIGLADDLAVSLNINNIFDEEPPELRRNGGSGFANGSTVGRLFMVGVNAQF